MEPTKRNIHFDLVRVIAMTLVIAVHSNPKPFAETSLAGICFYTILYMCNGLFYMLSGNLNLRKEFSTKKDYITFYKNKCITLLLPFCLGSILQSIYNYEGDFRISWMIKTIIRNFFSDNSGTSLWFMYPLIGMILSTPFLSKMLHTMKDWEIKLLFSIGVIWQIFSIYLPTFLEISFAFNSWLLSSWMFHYFLGYFAQQIVTSYNKKKFYAWALMGFLITILSKYYLKDTFIYAYDLSLAHILLTLGIYIFVNNEISIQSSSFQKTIVGISTHSFTIYLIHNIVKKELNKILEKAILMPVLRYFMHFTLTFCISLLLAVIINKLVLVPLQKFLRKL